jgi:photosystem II stability/assembly factor-like uncharacterized protein
MKKLKLNNLLTLLLLIPALSFGQWVSNGPYGGSILAITEVNNKVFAGTMQNGVFMSSDEGATWSAANHGIERRNVQALISKNGDLYAGTSDNGVYFSSDDGATWSNRSAGLGNVYIVSLFASTAGIYASTGEELYFSNDKGLSWTKESNFPFTYAVYSWAQVGNTVYAGTYANGLYSSTDGSGTWAMVSGFPNGTSAYVYSMVSDGNDIWAGAFGGIRHSSDGGVTWSLTNNGMPSGEWASTIAYKSGVLLAGTHNGGIFRSTDNGNNWTAVNTGIKQWPNNYPQVYATFKDIEFVGSSTALAGNFEGMYRSTDNGSTWNFQSEGILATQVMETEADGSTIYAATGWSGMFVSENNGETWVRRNNGLPSPHLLATATQHDWAFTAVENFGIYRTNDKGLNWSSANNGILGRVESIEADEQRVIAVTAATRYVERRLFQSTDHGATWTEVNTSAAPPISAVEVRGESIYIGSFDGRVSWTTNGGNSWTDITGYIPTAEVSSILSLSDDEVYVGTRGKGVWKITHFGHNSDPMSIGFTNLHITDLEFQNDVLFAGTRGSGVFVSQNRAASWFAVNGGLTNQFVDGLGGANGKVYVATGVGVYNSNTQMYDNIMLLSGIGEQNKQSLNVMPNPSSGKFSVAGIRGASAVIKIYDIQGSLVQQVKISQATEFTIDLSEYKKGVYILQCVGEADNYTARIVLQ